MKNISAVDTQLFCYVNNNYGADLKEQTLDKLMDRYDLSSQDTPDLDLALSEILKSQERAGELANVALLAMKQLQEFSSNELIIVEGQEINIQEWIDEIEGKKVDRGPTLITFAVSSLTEAMGNLEGQFRSILEASIKSSLDRLNKGERIPLNSDNCEGDGISTLEYSDTINFVDSEGKTIIYNNYDCETDGIAYDDADIWGKPLEVMIEIANCVDEYMRKTNRANYLNEK